MKIDIEIQDASLFTQVALMVDRPKIRKEITIIRNKWTGGKTYPSVQEWKSTRSIHIYPNDIIELIVKSEISPVFAPILEEAIFTGKVTKFSRVLSIPMRSYPTFQVLQIRHPNT